MARCQRCGSRGAIPGYCAACSTLDPFPRSRVLAIGAGVLAFAAVLGLVIYFASR
jgi:hypothetical protein